MNHRILKYYIYLLSSTLILLSLFSKCKKKENTEEVTPFIKNVTPLSANKHFNHYFEEINWVDNISENVKIELFYDDMYLGDIASSTESDGLYEWDVDDTIKTANNYSIKISSVNDENLFCFSNYPFSVGYVYDEGNVPYVKILYPNGNETIHYGEHFTVEWVTNVEGRLKILLLRNGYRVGEIAGPGTYNNSFTLEIHENFRPGNTYKVRVCSAYDYSIGDNSDECFTLTSYP